MKAMSYDLTLDIQTPIRYHGLTTFEKILKNMNLVTPINFYLDINYIIERPNTSFQQISNAPNYSKNLAERNKKSLTFCMDRGK